MTPELDSSLPILLSLSSISISEKPSKADKSLTGRISNSLKTTPSNCATLTEALKQGYSFTPSIYTHDKRLNDHWISSSLITLDYDSGVTFQEIEHQLHTLGFHINIWYHTFSYTPETPKFRIILWLDTLITTPDLYSTILEWLSTITGSDKACTHLASMFYPGPSHTVFHVNNVPNTFYTCILELLRFTQKQTTESALTTRTAAKKVKHIVDLSPQTLKNESFSDVSPIVPIQRFNYEDLIAVSPTFKAFLFVERRFKYKDLLVMATNLVYLSGGAKRYKECLELWDLKCKTDTSFHVYADEDYSLMKNIASMSRRHPYKPSTFQESFDPELVKWGYRNILDFYYKTQAVRSRCSYTPPLFKGTLVENRAQLTAALALPLESHQMSLVQATTGIGKSFSLNTFAAEELIKPCPLDRPMTFVFHSHEAKRQAVAELTAKCAPELLARLNIQPDLPQYHYEKEISKYTTLYGFSTTSIKACLDALKTKIESTTETNTLNSLNLCEDYATLENYEFLTRSFLAKVQTHTTFCLIHQVCIALDTKQQTFANSRIFYHETVFSHAFQTYTMTLPQVQELKKEWNHYVTTQKLLPEVVEEAHQAFKTLENIEKGMIVPNIINTQTFFTSDFWTHMITLPYGTLFKELVCTSKFFIFTKNGHVSPMRTDDYITGAYSRDFSTITTHPQTIVSATMQPEYLKRLFKNKEGIRHIALDRPHYVGRITWIGKRKWYRNDVQKTDYTQPGIKTFFEQVQTFLGPDIVTLTYKDYHQFVPSQLNPYQDVTFMNAEGTNELKGKPLLILGTPLINQASFLLKAKLLGFDTVNACKEVREYCTDSYRTEMMAYVDNDLCKLEFDLMEDEMSQIVGRARAVSEFTKVLILGGIPSADAHEMLSDFNLFLDEDLDS
jgi:hypothetical protein